jgi:hypothetical protein
VTAATDATLDVSEVTRVATALSGEVTLAATARPRARSVGMEVTLPLSYQQQTSIVATATVSTKYSDLLLAGQVFPDFLFTSLLQKTPIHDKLKKLGGHIAHEFTMMFHVEDSVTIVPWKGGPRQRWTLTIQTNGGISPRSVQRYTRRASDIERLFESVEWIFLRFKSLPTTRSALSEELSKIEEVWDCFGSIVPLFL